MIRIEPPDDYGPLDEACARAGTFDWIVFSSANRRRRVHRPAAEVAARPARARRREALRRRSGDSRAPGAPRSESRSHAGGIPRGGGRPGDLADGRRPRPAGSCCPHADIGREVIAEELRKQGAEVTEVVAYRTVATEPERDGEPDVYRMLLERRIDVVTFTSPSAVRSFVGALGARAGRRPAADDGRRVDRAGDGGGGGAVRHPDDDRAGQLHGSRAGGRHRGILRGTTGQVGYESEQP